MTVEYTIQKVFMDRSIPRAFMLAIALGAVLAIASVPASAHCDTMNGPVVKAAQKALTTKNVNYILIWVEQKDENEVKAAFSQVLKVRRLNRDARSLADKYFFETVVRLHRTNEGEPYTGIKPVGTEIEPIVRILDDAIDTGRSTTLLGEFKPEVKPDVEGKFNRLIELRQYDVNNVAAGREYVRAYVTFIHYVETLVEGARG